MGRHSTSPTLYDETLQFSITDLKKWGYFQRPLKSSGLISWKRNGEKFASIAIHVNTIDAAPFITLDYKFRDEPRKYNVRLTSMPSNLGKGIIWYFLCPETNKRCRKLYSIGGYFLHRDAFSGCMYDCQTKSKYYRDISKTFGAYFKAEELYEQLHKKYFKKFYAGKPTKRYLHLMRQINKAESIPTHAIERLMITGR